MGSKAPQGNLDRTAFMAHFGAFWGRHEWPEDAHLTINYVQKGSGYLASMHVSIHDPEKVWDAIVSVGSDQKTWIGVAPRSMDALLAEVEKRKAHNAEVEATGKGKRKSTSLVWIRGGKAECYSLPGFSLDLDVSMLSAEHGEHKLDKPADGTEEKVFPTREQVDEWLEECPIKPTVLNWTGGGYHAWWAHGELLDAEAEAALLSRFKKYWENIKDTSGLHIDVGTLESSRVMRPSGSLKGKGEPDVFFAPIETVHVDRDAAYGVEDFAFCPEIEEPKRKKLVKKDDGTTEKVAVTARTQADQDALPGVKLSHSLPVSEMLEHVLDFQRDDDKYTAVWDGAYEEGAVHASVVRAGDGAEVVRVFGERTAVDMHVDSQRVYSSFGLLINTWCGGDAALAARIAAHFEHNPEDLLELLQSEPTAEELAGAFPSRANTMVEDESAADTADTRPGGDVPVEPEMVAAIEEIGKEAGIKAAPSLTGAIEGNDSFRQDLGEGYFLQINRKNPRVTGLWQTVKEPHPTEPDVTVEKHNRLVDWVAWRPSVVEPLLLDPVGNPVPAADARYSVQLVTAEGRVFSKDDFTRKESVDAEFVQDSLNAGVDVPVTPSLKKRMDNMLRKLGRHTDQVQEREYTSTGTLRESGRHIYLAPGGSVSGAGIETEYSVGAAQGSAKGQGLSKSQQLTGFDRIPMGEAELRETAAALTAFMAITPTRKDQAYSALGLLFGSVLPMSRHTTVAALTEPDSGKSLYMSALQAFFSSVGVDGNAFSFTFSNRSTSTGAGVVTRWHNSSLGCYDDFRFTGRVDDDRRMTGAFDAIVQNAYGADGPTKGAADGGSRTTSGAKTSAFITGEGAAPTGTAIHGRMVTLQMAKGDYAITPRGESPLDTFASDYAATGLARSFFAAYISWVMRQIDLMGGVEELQTAVDNRKKEWAKNVPGRSSETTSTLMAGWFYLDDFAAEMGITDMMPSLHEVSKVLQTLGEANAASTSESTPGRAVVKRITEMLAGNSAYVVNHAKERPMPLHCKQLGWTRETNYHNDLVWTHGNKLLMGALSEDRKFVHVTGDSMKKVKISIGMGDMSPDMFAKLVKDYVRPGTKPGERASTDLGITGRPRGYTFPIETLEIELDEPEQPAKPVQDDDDDDNY